MNTTLYARVVKRIPGTDIGCLVLLPSGRQGIVRGSILGCHGFRLDIEYLDEPGEGVALKRELVKFL